MLFYPSRLRRRNHLQAEEKLKILSNAELNNIVYQLTKLNRWISSAFWKNNKASGYDEIVNDNIKSIMSTSHSVNLLCYIILTFFFT